MDFRGLSDGFLGVFRGFPTTFQMDFRVVLGGSQIIIKRFSVPLNQILLRMYSEHKCPLVHMEAT